MVLTRKINNFFLLNNFVEVNEICFAFNEMRKWIVLKNGYSKNSWILGYFRTISVDFFQKYLFRILFRESIQRGLVLSPRYVRN
jgi:hypothetical protein